MYQGWAGGGVAGEAAGGAGGDARGLWRRTRVAEGRGGRGSGIWRVQAVGWYAGEEATTGEGALRALKRAVACSPCLRGGWGGGL